MNTLFTQSFKILICFLLTSIIMFSCKQDSEAKLSTDSNHTVPELLTRSEKIRYGKEWDEVMSQYQSLKLKVEKDNYDHESLLRLASIFIHEARITGEHGHYYPAALQMTEWILSSDKKDPKLEFLALATKAGVQLSLHDFSEALKTGQQAILLNNRSAQIYGVLVDANVELGNYEEAIKMADIMISIKPDLRSYARISYLREIHGKIPEAIEAMKLAIAAGIPGHEDTAWAMHTLAEIYERYGKLKEAKMLNEEILAMRPDYPFAVGSLGNIALLEGNISEAKEITQNAMDIIPEVGFYIQMVEIAKKEGNKPKMDSLLQEVFAMLKDDEDHGHNMNLEYASIYLDILDDTDQALVYASKEYSKRPDNIDVNRIMARIYQSKDDMENMQKYLTAASRTNSKHPELAVISGEKSTVVL